MWSVVKSPTPRPLFPAPFPFTLLRSIWTLHIRTSEETFEMWRHLESPLISQCPVLWSLLARSIQSPISKLHEIISNSVRIQRRNLLRKFIECAIWVIADKLIQWVVCNSRACSAKEKAKGLTMMLALAQRINDSVCYFSPLFGDLSWWKIRSIKCNQTF